MNDFVWKRKSYHCFLPCSFQLAMYPCGIQNSSCMSWERLCWASQTFGAGHAWCFSFLPLRDYLMDKWGNRGVWQPWCFTAMSIFLHISAGFDILPAWHYCSEDRMCQETVYWGLLRFWVVSRFKGEYDWWEVRNRLVQATELYRSGWLKYAYYGPRSTGGLAVKYSEMLGLNCDAPVHSDKPS